MSQVFLALNCILCLIYTTEYVTFIAELTKNQNID